MSSKEVVEAINEKYGSFSKLKHLIGNEVQRLCNGKYRSRDRGEVLEEVVFKYSLGYKISSTMISQFIHYNYHNTNTLNKDQ